jgi:Rv2525c-like, glycoside hydrolase-like domain
VACAPTKSPAPGGSGAGFDACDAPSTGAMNAWLQSPYRFVGVYIGGSNRGCRQPNLNADWVSQVHGMGWGLIPTYVGLQAPCASGDVGPTIDPNNPYNQGIFLAQDAVNQAQGLGLPPGTPIYYDMEAYNPSVCGQVVRTFISGWIFQLHQNSYVAGMYGSSGAGVNDIAAAQSDPTCNCPLDAIWFAHWNGDPSLYGDPYFPDSVWQGARIHQYQGGHDENWGGVTINIDNDSVGGPTG